MTLRLVKATAIKNIKTIAGLNNWKIMVLEFYCDCVAWDRKDIPALCDLVDQAIDITRRTFLKHVSDIDLHYIEDLLGYARH